MFGLIDLAWETKKKKTPTSTQGVSEGKKKEQHTNFKNKKKRGEKLKLAKPGPA